MKITTEGLSLIKQFEGFRSIAYRDAVGVWTIGYGHTAMAGAPDVKPGMTITQVEGEQILARDVELFARGVRQVLTVTLSDQQFSALISFAYNIGLGNFRKSSVFSAVNRKDFAAVARRLQLWNRAGGRVLPGLVRRRAAEAALFGAEHVDVPQAPVERTPAKPVHHSKTVWSATATLVIAVLQAWLVTGQKLAGLVVLLAMAGLLSLIIYERWKKLKEEAL
jgi:lysozyme